LIQTTRAHDGRVQNIGPAHRVPQAKHTNACVQTTPRRPTAHVVQPHKTQPQAHLLVAPITNTFSSVQMSSISINNMAMARSPASHDDLPLHTHSEGNGSSGTWNVDANPQPVQRHTRDVSSLHAPLQRDEVELIEEENTRGSRAGLVEHLAQVARGVVRQHHA
jgi:hypothetical protein